MLAGAFGKKGVRFDVVAHEGRKLYDIEMQVTNHKDLPQRIRYYQGMLDKATLDSGKDYRGLKQTYIIFICTFDAFGWGLPVYERVQRVEDFYAYSDAVERIRSSSDERSVYAMYEESLREEIQNELIRQLGRTLSPEIIASALSRSVEEIIKILRGDPSADVSAMNLH